MSNPGPSTSPPYHLHHLDEAPAATATLVETSVPGVAYQATIGATFRRPSCWGGEYSSRHYLTVGASTPGFATTVIREIETAWRQRRPDLLQRVTPSAADGFDDFAFARFSDSVAFEHTQQHTVRAADQNSPSIDSFSFVPFTTHWIPVSADSGTVENSQSPSAGQGDSVVVASIAFRLVVGDEYPIRHNLLDVGLDGKLTARYVKKPRLTPAAKAALIVAMLCMTGRPSSAMRYSLPQELHRYVLLTFGQWESWGTEPLPGW